MILHDCKFDAHLFHSQKTKKKKYDKDQIIQTENTQIIFLDHKCFSEVLVQLLGVE